MYKGNEEKRKKNKIYRKGKISKKKLKIEIKDRRKKLEENKMNIEKE